MIVGSIGVNEKSSATVMPLRDYFAGVKVVCDSTNWIFLSAVLSQLTF
jgi:hypothetical protein